MCCFFKYMMNIMSQWMLMDVTGCLWKLMDVIVSVPAAGGWFFLRGELRLPNELREDARKVWRTQRHPVLGFDVAEDEPQCYFWCIKRNAKLI